MWLFGRKLPNPIAIASGTFRYDIYDSNPELHERTGIFIPKSIKHIKTAGNPQPRIAEISRDDILEIDKNYCISDLADAPGMVNCIGLQQPGVNAFITQHLPHYQRCNARIIPSVAGDEIEDYIYVILQLDKYSDLFIAYEINVSCPNVSRGLVFGTDAQMTYALISSLRKITKKPLIGKLTPNVPDICVIARAALDAGADGLSLINTVKVTAKMRDGRTITGGLSGPMIFPIACRLVGQVCEAFPNIPVIAGGGVWSAENVKTLLDLGATAVSVGTLNFTPPDAVLNLIAECESLK